MSGLPAAGKSTWAKKWCEQHGWKWCEFDKIHPEWHRPDSIHPEIEYKKARMDLVDVVGAFLKQGWSVVVDDNCIYRSMRRQFLHLAALSTRAFLIQLIP